MSQTLSEIGSQATTLTLPLLVLSLTRSAVAAGVVGSIAALTRVVLRLPAGVLIDRVDRRRLMMLCEAVRAGALGLLGLALVTGTASLGVIALVAIIDAAGYVFFSTAERVTLRHLVEPQQVPAASASNEARTYTAGLIGPSLGGVLFGLARAAPFLADAFSYLISFSAVALIGKPLQEPHGGSKTGWRTSFAEGWTFMMREPFLRAVALFVPLLNFAFAGTMFTTILVLQRSHVPAGLIGVNQAVIAVGGIVGAVAAPRLMRTLRPHLLIVLLCLAMTSGVALCALLPSGPWRVAPMPVLTVLVPSVNAAIFGHQARITPDRVYGRVISVQIFLSTLIGPIAPLGAGLVIDRSGAGAAYGIFAACLAVAALIAVLSRGLRSIDTVNALR